MDYSRRFFNFSGPSALRESQVTCFNLKYSTTLSLFSCPEADSNSRPPESVKLIRSWLISGAKTVRLLAPCCASEFKHYINGTSGSSPRAPKKLVKILEKF